MIVTVLSPWPTTPAALSAARTCLNSAILENLADGRLDALGTASSAMVERYTPDAPQAIKNEATIRLRGRFERG